MIRFITDEKMGVKDEASISSSGIESVVGLFSVMENLKKGVGMRAKMVSSVCVWFHLRCLLKKQLDISVHAELDYPNLDLRRKPQATDRDLGVMNLEMVANS